MIFNSIRWRLQVWYGLILLAVLTGFGVMAFQLERGRQLRTIDEELNRHIRDLFRTMRVFRPHDRGPGERLFHPPLPQPREERPGPGEPPREGPSERTPHSTPEFRLSLQQAILFGETDTNGFYYVVWQSDGQELARSTNAPADVPPPNVRPPLDGPGQPEPARSRGIYREAYLSTPPGEIILAGRSIARDQAELNRIGWSLAAVGGGILLVGLAGGWWLASRAIRPIDDISATAAKISAGDLSQRINVADTENELGRLATVLNSTFARLEAAFAQQRQFTSDAAHELRTPVSVILTQIQSTLNRERSGPEYCETLDACQRAAQRMRQLIESLLELARLDAGQEAMKCAPLDLAHTAADCVELVRPLATDRHITIHTDLSPAPSQGDSERLAQVITNLLSNAVHYNREHGNIHVTTGNGNGFATVTVSDTGPGIAPEHLPHIFKRFYRADTARTAAGGRTGLGLAISKSIVEAHGGTIEVTSQPGAQTTFTVRLPT